MFTNKVLSLVMRTYILFKPKISCETVLFKRVSEKK